MVNFQGICQTFYLTQVKNVTRCSCEARKFWEFLLKFVKIAQIFTNEQQSKRVGNLEEISLN